MPSLPTRLLKPLLHIGMRLSNRLSGDFVLRRAQIERNERLVLALDHGFSRRDETITGIPSQWITTPVSDPDTILLYLHGGGFCVRTPVVHGQFLAKLCRGSGATGLMPDYRLAPEHPFPAAYEDGLAVYSWLLEQRYDPKRIVLAGDSAGGALTLGTLLQARSAGLPLPACAVMFSPGLGALHNPEVLAEVKEGPLLTFETMQIFGKAIGVSQHPEHPLALLIENDFAGLPPLLFQAGGDEILLQDSIRGAAKAQAAGVEAQLEVYEGMMHVFQLIPLLPEARSAIHQAVDFICRHLPPHGH